MNTYMAWCGFLGAWLLVAGPLHQASRELEEEGFEREDLARAATMVERPAPVSKWWWLLPPVGYVLHRRRAEEYRRKVAGALPAEKLAALERFRDKADAWASVATGAFLIAVKETWDLHEAAEWTTLAFWLVVALMVVLCVANARRRMKRRRTAAIAESS